MSATTMAKVAALAVIGFLAMAMPAAADVSGLLGATVVGTFGDGRQVKVRLHADGTFNEVLPDGSPASGTWTDGVDGVCFTETSPPPPAGTKPDCLPSLSGKKVGDIWDLPGPHPFKMAVVAGAA